MNWLAQINSDIKRIRDMKSVLVTCNANGLEIITEYIGYENGHICLNVIM